MANNKLKTHALKKILQNPESQIQDEELFRLVKKQDRSAESLVLKKFISAISEIPLIEYSQTSKIFSFNRNAQKARNYFIFMSYLFGVSVASKWPDFKKFTTKIKDVTLSHFVNSYCLQTTIQEKLTAYNTQMTILIDFILKQGKGKDSIFDKLINETLIDYFPTFAINWVWVFNEVVKGPRPKNLVSSTLTLEKAHSQLIKCAKKAAKECEIEVQRLRVDPTPSPTQNWADVASAKVSSTGQVNKDPVQTEAIPLSADLFPVILGRDGGNLKHIQIMTGSKITLGKMRNGQSGFLVQGTKKQNDEAISEVLKLVGENSSFLKPTKTTAAPLNAPSSKAVPSPKPAPEPQDSVNVITYSSDILEKFVTNKKLIREMGKFTEKYPTVNVSVEPHKQRVVVKGKNSASVKQVGEYLRETLGDFASDLISRSKPHHNSSVKTSDTPVTRPLSAGYKHNSCINENKNQLLVIALRHHVTLRFPAPHRPTDMLTLSGKLQNVEHTDRAILAEIEALKNQGPAKMAAALSSQGVSSPKPLEPPKHGTQTTKKSPTTPRSVDKALPYSKKTSTDVASNIIKSALSAIAKDKSDDAKNEKSTSVPVKMETDQEKTPKKRAASYETMDLAEPILSGVHVHGLKKPSYVHGVLIPLLMSEKKVAIEAELGPDVCGAICIAALTFINCKLSQTQGFILVRDKLLIQPIINLLQALATTMPLRCHGLYDTTPVSKQLPHIVCCTPPTLLEILKDKETTVKTFFLSRNESAKVVIFIDLALTVGNFGYQILQPNNFNNLINPSTTKLVFQSGEALSTKINNQLEKISDSQLQTVKFGSDDIEGEKKFTLDKKSALQAEKVIETPLNNLTVHQAELASRNNYLVYGVTKGFPDIEVIKSKEGAIILRGKSADVNACKTKIQDMIILHDKVDQEKLPTSSQDPDSRDSTLLSITTSPVKPPPGPTRPPNADSSLLPTATRRPNSQSPPEPQVLVTSTISQPVETTPFPPNVEPLPVGEPPLPTVDFNFMNSRGTPTTTRRPNTSTNTRHSETVSTPTFNSPLVSNLPSPVSVPPVSVPPVSVPPVYVPPVSVPPVSAPSLPPPATDSVQTQESIQGPLQKKESVQLITKLVSMTPLENGFIYRNRAIIEDLVKDFPSASIELSPYENGNISVTGPVTEISQIHKRVVMRIRDAVESNSSLKTNISGSPSKSIAISSGRLATELDSYLSNTTQPHTTPSISFDTSAELQSVSSGSYDQSRRRHEHTIVSPVVTMGGAGPPPGYGAPEGSSPLLSLGPAPQNNVATSKIISEAVSTNAPTNHVSQPSTLDEVPSIRPVNPPTTSFNFANPSSLDTLSQSNPYQTRPPNPQTRSPDFQTRPPNFSEPPSSNSYLPQNVELPPANRPPNTNSSLSQTPSPDMAATSRAPHPMPAATSRAHHPMPLIPLPSVPLPPPSSELAIRPHTANYVPVVVNDVYTAGNSVSTAGNSVSTAGNSVSTAGNSLSTAGNSVSTAGNSVSTSRTPHAVASSGPQSLSQNATLQQLSDHLAPNGYPWRVLQKIPVRIPGIDPGTPEHWVYTKLRDTLNTGHVSSVPLIELAKVFAHEFQAGQHKLKDLINEFYHNIIKSKPGIFTTNVIELAGGKKSINVSLNLPKRLSPAGSRASTPKVRTNSIGPGSTKPSPSHTFPLNNFPPGRNSSPSPAARTPADPGNVPVPTTVHSAVPTTMPPTSVAPHPAPHTSNTLPTMLGGFPIQSISEPSISDSVTKPSLFNHGSSMITEDLLFSSDSNDKSDSLSAENSLSGQKTDDFQKCNPTQNAEVDEAQPGNMTLETGSKANLQSGAITSDSTSDTPASAVLTLEVEPVSTVSSPGTSSNPTLEISQTITPAAIANSTEITPASTAESAEITPAVPLVQSSVTTHVPATPQFLEITTDATTAQLTESITVSTSGSSAITPVPISESPVITPVPTTPSPVITPISTTPSPDITPVPTTTSPVITPVSTTPSPVITPVSTTPSPVITPVSTTTSPVITPVSTTTPSPVITPVSTTTSSSPGSDYDLCGRSEVSGEEGGVCSDHSSTILVDKMPDSGDPSGAESSTDTKEDELDSTFTQLEINDTVEPNKEEQEEPEKENKVEVDLEEEEEEDEEEHFTTFYCSKRQTSCSIGFSDTDSRYVNINLAEPSWILVHGGDMATKNAVMKQLVDVWVSRELPVLVISPKLETVSAHSHVDFYQFKALTAAEDPDLVARCEDFLTRDSSLKLLLINTTHKAVDTNNFLSVLAEQYSGFNVVVVSIAPPPEIETITGLITSWRRLKRDKVLDEISSTFDITFGSEVEQIKRGTLVSVSLDGEETMTVSFSCLSSK